MTAPRFAATHKPPFPDASAICRLPAVELARRIRERRIPVVEVVGAFLDRIEAVSFRRKVSLTPALTDNVQSLGISSEPLKTHYPAQHSWSGGLFFYSFT